MKNSFLLTFCLWFLHSLNAQWEPMHGPYGGWIYDLEQNNTYQFVSTGHGLYRSGDNGISWDQLKIGDFPISSSWSIGINREQLVVSVKARSEDEHQSYLYRSDDNGNSWTMISRPDTAYFQSEIAINDHGIYLSWNYDLWVSTDEGLTWNYSSLDTVINYFDALSVYDGHIYVGSYKKYYKSSLDSDEWEEIEVDGMGESVNTIHVFDSLIFIREYQYGKLYRSEDGGDTWTYSLDPDWGNGWTNFVKIENFYYANDIGRIFRSEDDGKSWVEIDDVYVGSIYKMIGSGQTILAGTLGEGIFRSTDLGFSFLVSNSGLGATHVNAIETDQNNLWTGSDRIGVSRYNKSTAMWDSILLPTKYSMNDIQVLDNRIFAIVDYNEVFRSEDGGISWLNKYPYTGYNAFTRLYVYGHSIMAGGLNEFESSYLTISDNYGDTWTTFSFYIDNKQYWPSLFSQNSNTLFTSNSDNVFRSLDNGLTWQVSSYGLNMDSCWCTIVDLLALDDLVFLQVYDEFNSSNNLFISRDNGETWDYYYPDISEEYFDGFDYITGIENILLATSSSNYSSCVYISFDNAVTWQIFDEGLSLTSIYSITSDDDYLYAATSGQGVWRRPIQDLYTVSNKEISSEEEFLIFPNPSHRNIHVKTESASPGEARLLIHDVSGRILESRDIFFDKLLELNTNHLPPGLYILSLQTAEKVYSGKFVVQD